MEEEEGSSHRRAGAGATLVVDLVAPSSLNWLLKETTLG